MVFVEIGRCEAHIVLSLSSFIPFFIFFFYTFPFEVSCFQHHIYEDSHHEGYGAVYIGTCVSM